MPIKKTFQIVFLVNVEFSNIMLRPEEHSEYGWFSFVEAKNLDLIRYLGACLENEFVEDILKAHGL